MGLLFRCIVIVKVLKGTYHQAIGKSKGRMVTKILALTISLGNLVKFRLMLGRYHDLAEVEPLIENTDFHTLFADKAFNVDWLLKELDD